MSAVWQAGRISRLCLHRDKQGDPHGEWGALKARKRSGLLAQPGGVRRATEANRCTGLAGGAIPAPSEPDSNTGLIKPEVLGNWGECFDPQVVIGRLGLGRAQWRNRRP
jgi:hypothetical protein